MTNCGYNYIRQEGGIISEVWKRMYSGSLSIYQIVLFEFRNVDSNLLDFKIKLNFKNCKQQLLKKCEPNQFQVLGLEI